jgi:hypothetical protein
MIDLLKVRNEVLVNTSFLTQKQTTNSFKFFVPEDIMKKIILLLAIPVLAILGGFYYSVKDFSLENRDAAPQFIELQEDEKRQAKIAANKAAE